MAFVSFISSIVLFYRTFYIYGDKNFYRFIILVFLFVLSIFFLIIRPNIIRILLGWDGLGLVSYCLVIYYQNVKSANAGILTILSNRVGDVAILLRISWFLNFGSWNFFYFQHIFNYWEVNLILFLVILAALTKRAQIPFSAWLPAAIAAPTPVSALVHSSTLVTAGVYLLIRFSPILEERNFLFFISLSTIIISGLGANFENDLKKIIALSTLSQLGVIIITLSLGYYELSFFHLLTHALFKSLLFLCAGVIIHGMGDIQDIRYLGGLREALPVISLFFMGASLALCGFPFISGFYSKDLILEIFFYSSINSIMLFLVFISTIFTISYSLRLTYYLFFKRMGLRAVRNLGEEAGIYKPIFILFVFSIVAGCWIIWLFLPPFLVYLPLLLKIMIIFSILILLMLFIIIKMSLLITIIFYKANFYFWGLMWFLPHISVNYSVIILGVGKKLITYFDQGWIEKFGGLGINSKLRSVSIKLDVFNNLNLKSYLLFFIILLVILFLLLYLYSLNVKA